MLKTLINKEILNNLLNLRFSLAYFLTTLLLVGSAAIMISDYVTQKKAFDIDRTVFARQGQVNGNDFDSYMSEKTVVRPPSLTRIFAIGGEKDPDTRATIGPLSTPYFAGNFKRNPLTNLFPALDAAFIIGVILSLLIFILTYDIISGEREEGTLKVLLSCPVPRDQILIAKWLGGFASLIIPLITSWIIIMLLLLLTPGITLTSDTYIRLFTLLPVFALYVAVVFSLSLMVSVLFEHSQSAILALLAVWVLGIVTIPAISTPLAYLGTKSVSARENQLAMLQTKLAEIKTTNTELGKIWMSRLNPDGSPQMQTESDWNEFNRTMTQAAGHIRQQYNDSIIASGQNFARHEAAVDNTARFIARLSPYGCFTNICVAVAATGIGRDHELRAALEEYSRKVIALESGQNRRRRSGPPAIAPQFVLPVSSFAKNIEACVLDAALLLLCGILFFMVAYLKFMKMEAL